MLSSVTGAVTMPCGDGCWLWGHIWEGIACVSPRDGCDFRAGQTLVSLQDAWVSFMQNSFTRLQQRQVSHGVLHENIVKNSFVVLRTLGLTCGMPFPK